MTRLAAPIRLLTLAAGIACLAGLPRPAAALEIDIGNGESLEIAPFDGYCAVDESRGDEAELVRRARKAVGDTVRVVMVFGDCAELVDLRSGKRAVLDHFGQVLLGLDGEAIRRIPEPQQTFLESATRALPTATPEDIAANGEAQLAAARPDQAPKPIFGMVGRDDMAAYVGTAAAQDIQGKRGLVAGIAGVTLVRQVPVTINLFGAYTGGKDKGIEALEALLGQMAMGIADLHFFNEGAEAPTPLPVPNRSEWRAMGSTALIGAVIGGGIGGIGALIVVWLRRRRQRHGETSGIEAGAEG